ncbi:hypothetical protein [Bacillus atrophaeus]|uniref:hypothetical protein n=1 Tax=Bacillus atrophaeus TaxID=1452 RepID=UPI002282EFE3|nr:hypothetical protein [Bacillus atrophaeus]MCY8512226.1 hypothetical protein [Bacillus atrophaeus]MCY8993087.1 hypothetical protein [Bacillus atrophaeus]
MHQKFDDSKGSFSDCLHNCARYHLFSSKRTLLREERETPAEQNLLSVNEDTALPISLEAEIIEQHIEHLTAREKIYVIEHLLEGYSYKVSIHGGR